MYVFFCSCLFFGRNSDRPKTARRYPRDTLIFYCVTPARRGCCADVRSRGHVALRRQKVLSDFSKKFLRREISFRGTPGEGPSLCMPLCGMQIHSSCARRTHKEFRALRSASRGAAPTPREPLKRLDPNFVSWYASKFYVNITKVV